MDRHAERIAIFNETLSIIRNGGYTSPSGKQITLPTAREVMSAATMYSQKIKIDTKDVAETEIRAENNDCIMEAIKLIDAGYNPAMLNLADLYTPGGLVEYGSGAQEENLCRRSNLILSLYQFSNSRIHEYPYLELLPNTDQYPMDERYGGIYSGKVTFFRSSESKESKLWDTPYNIPVISVAAISGPRIGADGMMRKAETLITLDKMRTIFRIGLKHGHDSLVLSAMGCGAFANPPAHIAKLFHQVILEPEFKNKYRLIDFAILDGYKTGLAHNPEGNFVPFKREFCA